MFILDTDILPEMMRFTRVPEVAARLAGQDEALFYLAGRGLRATYRASPIDDTKPPRRVNSGLEDWA
jgi:hypothetical protein